MVPEKVGSPTTIHRFLLRLPHMGRQISDEGWQHIEPEAAKQLRDLQKALNSESIYFDEAEYRFRFDFEPIAMGFLDHYERQQKFEQTKDWSIWAYYYDRRADCFIECEFIRHSNPESRHDHTVSILEFVLLEIFIIMGLTVPGTFNLEGAEFVEIPERRTMTGSVITYGLNTSAGLTEKFHYETIKQKWIPRTGPSSTQTLAWLRQVCPHFDMLADNPASRCILALLYLCRGDAYSGAGAAWLFNGFESLFSCGPGENRAALTRRMSILLQLNDTQQKHLKRAIGELYSIRSAFVHGGLPTVHPVRDGTMDKRVDDEIMKIMSAMDLGVTILLTVLRKLIEDGINWPRFDERLLR